MDTLLDWNGPSFRANRPSIRATAVRGEAHLYVIGYSSGTVKVGYSRSPSGRVGAHAGDASRHGVEVTSVWVSGPHVEYAANEATLKAWSATRCSEQQGAEYFIGLDPADVKAQALTLAASRNEHIEAIEKSARIPLPADFAEQVRYGRYIVIDGDDYWHYLEHLTRLKHTQDLLRKLLGKSKPGDLIGALRRAIRKLEQHPDGHLEWRLMHSYALTLAEMPEIEQGMTSTLDEVFGEILVARRKDWRAIPA